MPANGEIHEDIPDELTRQMQHDFDSRCLGAAIEEAQAGLAEGGVPVGAALVVDGDIVATGRNRRVQLGSVIRHGETDCLENGGRLPASTYARATMYTTLSPCPMCSGAILLYGIPRVVLGENRTFMGAEEELARRGVEVVNLDSDVCAGLMRDFIEAHPDIWNEDIGR
jgi:cytosine/creatinine deaminase